MTESNVNIPLLRKAVEWAESEATKSDGLWIQGGVSLPTDCGTAYCVGGWVAYEVGDYAGSPCDGRTPLDTAADMLGIPRWDGLSNDGRTPHIFDAWNSIQDVRRIAETIAGERL